MRDGGGKQDSTIFAAKNFAFICKQLLYQPFNDEYYEILSYSLVALPQLGWRYQRLMEQVWLPLKSLGEHRCVTGLGPPHSRLRVIDKTGVFAGTDETSNWGAESEQESDTESDPDSDAEENESDESDESDSEDGLSAEAGSDDDEIEEEDIGGASASSDEADSGVDDDDDDDDDNDTNCKAEDRSHEAGRNKIFTKDSGQKIPHNAASSSDGEGDADVVVCIKDNGVAEGCSDDEVDLKVPGDDGSDGGVEGTTDKSEC